MISGYIMVYTSTGPLSPRKFMARRIIRILPLYWAVTLFVFGIALVAPHLLKATSTNIEELLQSLFFIPVRQEQRSDAADLVCRLDA